MEYQILSHQGWVPLRQNMRSKPHLVRYCHTSRHYNSALNIHLLLLKVAVNYYGGSSA